MIKKNFKKGIVMAILLFAMIFAVACGNDENLSDLEMFEEAVRANLNRDSFSFAGELSFSSEDLQTEDPNLGMMLGMMSQIRLNMEGSVDQRDSENPKMHFEGIMNAMGMGIGIELYLEDHLMAVRAPMMVQILQDPRLMDGFLLMDTSTIEHEEYRNDTALILDEADVLSLFKYLGEAALSLMDEDFIENRGEDTITIAGEKVKATEMVVTIGGEEIEKIFRGTPDLIRDEEFRQRLKTIFHEGQQEKIDEELDALEEMLDDEAIDEGLQKMKEIFDFERTEIQYAFFINTDLQIVKEDGAITLAMDDGKESAVLEFKLMMEYWDINASIDIEIPEFNNDNSVYLEEILENMFMFPGI